MPVPLLRAEQSWSCPNCDVVDRTTDTRANPFHRCRGLAGLTAPLVPVGTHCKVTAHEREDYVGREQVQLHDVDGKARPIAQIRTTREDGEDCVVLAPTARVIVES
jgi:hypothetical protein